MGLAFHRRQRAASWLQPLLPTRSDISPYKVNDRQMTVRVSKGTEQRAAHAYMYAGYGPLLCLLPAAAVSFSSLQRSTACLSVNEVDLLASLSLVVLVRTSCRILRLSQVLKNFVERILLSFGFNLNSHYFARHRKVWIDLTTEIGAGTPGPADARPSQKLKINAHVRGILIRLQRRGLLQ